jgi:dienelactone hydrolase
MGQRRVTMARWAVLILSLLGCLVSVWRLEQARSGIEISALRVGSTPATVYRLPGASPAPVAVIAHGFAGSRQLMEGFALTLARAGYVAVSYDLEGHGRNPVPMSGDVTTIGGTTEILMDELARVTDAAVNLPGSDGRVALIGHSMASDIVVRQALRDPRVGATVAVSMFSRAVTPTEPGNLLVIAGAWEGMLAAEAEAALRQTDPQADLGLTVGDPGQGTGRRAVLAPSVEHVGVLYSGTTLRETRDWLDSSLGRSDDTIVPLRGGWIALLLVSVAALGWPLAALLRGFRAPQAPVRLATGRFLVALVIPALATPLVLRLFDTRFLPVLVADYLALHFALYGGLVLCFAALFGARPSLSRPVATIALGLAVAGFGILVFGSALDRYVASFWPVADRVPVVMAMALGAIPFMLADATLTEAGRAPLWRTLAVRGTALASLGLAVALDFERLFFLVIILPVILLFFLLFGTAGGWVGRATWRPGVSGIGLGIFLGWALGVTFPMFSA